MSYPPALPRLGLTRAPSEPGNEATGARAPKHPGEQTWIKVTSAWVIALLVLACGASSRPGSTPAPSTQALIERAEAAEAERRYDVARTFYARAKIEAPDAPSRAHAARTYGRALVFWGEYDQALAELEEATRLDPSDAGTWHDLGMVRHHRGDMAGAEQALRRSMAVSPRDPRSRIALAALLWKQQRHADALAEYEALAALDLPPKLRAKVEWAIGILRKRVEEAR